MHSNKTISPMKNNRTFKKHFLKADAVEYFSRLKKDKKRTRKVVRKSLEVVRHLTA